MLAAVAASSSTRSTRIAAFLEFSARWARVSA
jgi:hypothetical protein